MTILPSLFCRFLHLAVIHEAKDQAMKMIDLSINDPFLNAQNYQRQVHHISCKHIMKMYKKEKSAQNESKSFKQKRGEYNCSTEI